MVHGVSDTGPRMPSFVSDIVEVRLTSWRERRHELFANRLEEEVLGLFDLLRGPLLRYALSFGLSVHDGEDVLQETFLALLGHLQRGRSRENLHGWTFRVTHNLALKRRAARGVVHGELAITEELCDLLPNPEEQILLEEQAALLQSIFRVLPETDRRCLQLRAEGLRFREIAKVLGISLGSVSGSIARSLARLERGSQR